MKGSRRGSTDVIFLIWATHVLLTLPHTQKGITPTLVCYRKYDYVRFHFTVDSPRASGRDPGGESVNKNEVSKLIP